MKLPDFKPGCEPKFEPDEEAWIITGKTVRKTRILGINLIFFHASHGEKKAPVLQYKSYMCTEGNLDTADLSYDPGEVYKTEAEAQELAVWHPVVRVSKKTWLKAVGTRERQRSIDESELFPCCTNISHVRDILLKCQRQKGLIERDVCELCELLGQYHPEMISTGNKNLWRILKQLGFKEELATKE